MQSFCNKNNHVLQQHLCTCLSIFTTLVSGIGLTEPGQHLHQFFFPVEGSAAYNHLMHPFASTLATGDDTHMRPQASCPLSNIDQNMRLVAWKLGWKRYRRDYVEVHMCESLPGRYLNKKDIFFVGQNCFELNSLGIPCTQEYGNDIGWAVIGREHILHKKKIGGGISDRHLVYQKCSK